jgi:hypothetical protein
VAAIYKTVSCQGGGAASRVVAFSFRLLRIYCSKPSVLGRTAAPRGFRSSVERPREGRQVIQTVPVGGIQHTVTPWWNNFSGR